jgi:hypothetical protein
MLSARPTGLAENLHIPRFVTTVPVQPRDRYTLLDELDDAEERRHVVIAAVLQPQASTCMQTWQWSDYQLLTDS